MNIILTFQMEELRTELLKQGKHIVKKYSVYHECVLPTKTGVTSPSMCFNQTQVTNKQTNLYPEVRLSTSTGKYKATTH